MRQSNGGRLMLGTVLACAVLGWALRNFRAEPSPPQPRVAARSVRQPALEPTSADKSLRPTAPPDVQATIPNQTTRKELRRFSLEFTVFVTLFLILGLVGFLLFPPSGEISKMPTQFIIDTSYPSAVKISSLRMQEYHYSDGGIQFSIYGTFASTLTAATDFTLDVGMPYAGASLVSCDALSDLSCDIQQYDTSSTLSFRGSLASLSTGFNLEAEVSGIPGIGFKSSDQRVEAHFPSFDIPATYPFDVEVSYFVADLSKFSWSGTAPNRLAEDTAVWRYGSGGGDPIPGTASAIREDLVAKDSVQTFLAGTALGLAGAALIAALQALFVRSARLREMAGKAPRF